MTKYDSIMKFKQHLNGKWVDLCAIYETHETHHFDNIHHILNERIEAYLVEILQKKPFAVLSHNMYTSIDPGHGPIQIRYRVEEGDS